MKKIIIILIAFLLAVSLPVLSETYYVDKEGVHGGTTEPPDTLPPDPPIPGIELDDVMTILSYNWNSMSEAERFSLKKAAEEKSCPDFIDDYVPPTVPITTLATPLAAYGNGLSWETAFSKINDAIEVMHPGDTIWVAPAYYLERISLGNFGNEPQNVKTYILGEDMENTYILGGNIIENTWLVHYQDNTYYLANVDQAAIKGVACNQGEIYPPVNPRLYVNNPVELKAMKYNCKWRPFANKQADNADSNPIKSLSDCLNRPGSFWVEGARLYINFPYPVDMNKLFVYYYYFVSNETYSKGIYLNNSANLVIKDFSVIGYVSSVNINQSHDITLENIRTFGSHDATRGTEPNGNGMYFNTCDKITLKNCEIGNSNQISTEMQAHNAYGPWGLYFTNCGNLDVKDVFVWECQNAGSVGGSINAILDNVQWYDCRNHGMYCNSNSNITWKNCKGGWFCQDGITFSSCNKLTIEHCVLDGVASIADVVGPNQSRDVLIHNNVFNDDKYAYTFGASNLDVPILLKEYITYNNVFTVYTSDKVINKDLPGCGYTLPCIQALTNKWGDKLDKGSIVLDKRIEW